MHSTDAGDGDGDEEGEGDRRGPWAWLSAIIDQMVFESSEHV